MSSKVRTQKLAPRQGKRMSNIRDRAHSRVLSEIQTTHLLQIQTDAEFANVTLHPFRLYFEARSCHHEHFKIESAYVSWHSLMQRQLYRYSLMTAMFFCIISVYYDYRILIARDMAHLTRVGEFTSLEQSNVAFSVLLGVRVGLVLPVLLVTLYHTTSNGSSSIVWACNITLGVFPNFYNLLTNGYGASWNCIFLLFLFNCSPTTFFRNATMGASIVALHALTITQRSAVVSQAMLLQEILYLLAFYVVMAITSYSHEQDKRINFLSELLLFNQHSQLDAQKQQGHELLLSMLPESVVDQLNDGRDDIADSYEQVTVLFVEICNFDNFTSILVAEEVVELLNIVFSTFDRLVDMHRVYKVETIGAVYMVASGCPNPRENHAKDAAKLALSIIRAIPLIKVELESFSWGPAIASELNVRIGINTGPLVAGVIGIRNPRYKLFGDTVNTASRMETTSFPNQIHVSKSTHDLLAQCFVFKSRGKIMVKGKGVMETYFLIKKRSVERSSWDSAENDLENYAPAASVKHIRKVPDAENSFNRDLRKKLAAPFRSLSLDLILQKHAQLAKKLQNGPIASSLPSVLNQARQSVRTFITEEASTRFHGVKREPAFRRALLNFLANVDPEDEDNFKDDLVVPLSLVSKAGLFLGRMTPFEKEYRKYNQGQWNTTLRRTIILGTIISFLATLYVVLILSKHRMWQLQRSVFTGYFCILIPSITLFFVFTFTRYFRKWEQVCMIGFFTFISILVHAYGNLMVLNSGPHTILVLVVCRLPNMNFMTRLFIAVLTLFLFIMHELVNFEIFFAGEEAPKSTRLEVRIHSWLAVHGAFYFILFFGSSFWIVFDSEFKKRLIYYRNNRLTLQRERIRQESDLIRRLLLNLLPESIVTQLQINPTQQIVAEKFENVTILFTDMVNFTAFSSKITPMELVSFLNDLYTRFDTITDNYGLYKVEIIGDAYFAVGGCPRVTENHAACVIQAALDMINDVQNVAVPKAAKLITPQIRVGVHTGPVVAGIVGEKDLRYHLFGSAVAKAEQLESTGLGGRVHISSATYRSLRDFERTRFRFDYKAETQSYFIDANDM